MTTHKDQIIFSKRHQIKHKLVVYKGGKCQKCGYNKIQYLNAFDFHHRDPSIKTSDISTFRTSYENLLLEVDKCDLLCSRCHAEIHEDLEVKKRQKIKFIKCPICHKNFKSLRSKRIFCSQSCANKSRWKTKRPNKQQLHEMLKTMTYVNIAKKYHISDTTVRNWAKLDNIEIKKNNIQPNRHRGVKKIYYLLNPQGQEFIVLNMSQFCREYNFNRKHICHMLKGRNSEYKGWKLNLKGILECNQ
jgi:hypothetical protein